MTDDTERPDPDLAWVAETDRLLAARDTHPLEAQYVTDLYAHLLAHIPDVRAMAAEVERLREENSRLGSLAHLEHLWFELAVRRLRSAEADRDRARDVAAALEAELAQVREAVERHPDPCPEHPDHDVIRCGWKRAVIDVRRALDGAADNGEGM